jgi:hypothetical protein
MGSLELAHLERSTQPSELTVASAGGLLLPRDTFPLSEGLRTDYHDWAVEGLIEGGLEHQVARIALENSLIFLKGAVELPEALSPSPIDKAWHQLLNADQDYLYYMLRTYKTIIHHKPFMKEGDGEGALTPSATFRLLEAQKYGPDQEVWLADGGSNCASKCTSDDCHPTIINNSDIDGGGESKKCYSDCNQGLLAMLGNEQLDPRAPSITQENGYFVIRIPEEAVQ